MMDLLRTYQPLFDLFLLNVGFAFSQQVVLRAGVFSIGTAGFAALGSYAVAILVQRYHFPAIPSVLIGLLFGMAAGWLLSLPLSRLRGIFQAIATLAFVQIIVSLAFYAEDLTGGAMGINSIPKLVTTWHLVVIIAVVMYFMYAIDRSGIGRAFDAIRQDETVGAVLGVSISKYHALAFIISGALGGFFGGLQSLYVYSIEPEQFGFAFMVNVLTFIVLGGRGTIIGPVIGTAFLTALPELARPLAENRPLVNGALLMLIIAYMPHGLYDNTLIWLRNRRAAQRDRQMQGAANAVSSS